MIVLALTEQEATATLAAIAVFRRPRGRTAETIAAERVTVKLRQAVDHPSGDKLDKIGPPGCQCGGPTGGNCRSAECDSPWRHPDLRGGHHVGCELPAPSGVPQVTTVKGLGFGREGSGE